jgi:hypothetical protein
MKARVVKAVSVVEILLSGLVRFEGVRTEENAGESKQSSSCTDKNTPGLVISSQHRSSSSSRGDMAQHLPAGFDSRWEELPDSWHQKDAFAALMLIDR